MKSKNNRNILHILPIIVGLISITSQTFSQDYANDNKYYSTVSWQEFFNRLEQNPRLIYFDIRRPGERADTSESPSMNQGKLRGAIETDFFEFEKYYPEYLKHKNDTIYLYCSHSYRSRALAKQLADSSFKHVININAGLSHLNSCLVHEIPTAKKYLTNNLKYKLVTPLEFSKLLKEGKVQLIDVRSDSVYRGISEEKWDNMFGTVTGAVHIPADRISESLQKINKSKIILLLDNDGETAPLAAEYLLGKGFDARVLLFGLDNLISYLPPQDRTMIHTNYKFILQDALATALKDTNTVLIDIRTPSEYNSTDTTDWKNAGYIKGAINIPLADLSKKKTEPFKNKKIILYDLMMHDELFESAEKLKEYGITDFTLLYGGIAYTKWEAFNFGNSELIQLIAQ